MDIEQARVLDRAAHGSFQPNVLAGVREARSRTACFTHCHAPLLKSDQIRIAKRHHKIQWVPEKNDFSSGASQKCSSNIRAMLTTDLAFLSAFRIGMKAIYSSTGCLRRHNNLIA